MTDFIKVVNEFVIMQLGIFSNSCCGTNYEYFDSETHFNFGL